MNNLTNQAYATIHFLQRIFDFKLTIPEYQRPYRWLAEKHVLRLIQDIERECNAKNGEYRIGTVMFATFNDKKEDKWNTCEILQHHMQMVTILQDFDEYQ